MNPTDVEVRVLAESGIAPTQERVQATATLVERLMGNAAEQGDIEVALNSLLGAYLSLALRPPKGSGISTAKALGALGAAANAMLMDVSPAQAAPTHAETVIQLANRIGKFVCHYPHPVVLDALLNLFIEGALQNPCCTGGCASAAEQAAHRLTLAASAAAGAPTTKH